MKINVYTYIFPFKRPFATAEGTFSKRKGLYLRLRKNGITAWGEAAPLPGFSKETLLVVKNQLKSHLTEINELFEDSFSLKRVHSYLNSAMICPSLQFAIYTLASTWLAQSQGQSLHNHLFKNAKKRIPINAVLGLKEQNFIHRIDQFVEQGFETIKIKTDYQTDKLTSKIERIRQKYPQLSIRIDANQSWSLGKAAECLKNIEPHAIEYCEEPLAKPDAGKLEKLGAATTVPIALDESLAGSFSLAEAVGLVPVLILKPTILGNKALPENISELIKPQSKKITFTTALESGVGRLMTASLAGGLGSFVSAHGLGTGNLLKDDIWTDARFIDEGNYHLPDVHQLVKLMNQKVMEFPIEKIF